MLMSPTESVDEILERLPKHVQTMVPYRPGKPLDELKAEFGFDKVIKLASNENPFGMSDLAKAAAKDALDISFRYGDPISRKLRAKLAGQFAIQPEEIAIAAGSENLLAVISRAFMQMGDKAVLGDGAFLGFEIHARAIGGELVKVPSPQYRFDVNALIASCQEHHPKIFYLPNPNNPTGTYLNATELQKILAEVPTSTVIIVDEAYQEFCANLPDYPQIFSMRQDNVILCRTFSKAYGLAGLRVAYAVAHPRLIEQLMKVKMTFEPSNVAQAAAMAALDDTAFLKKVVDNNETEKARYVEFFKAQALTFVPSFGNFIMVELGTPEQVEAINQALLQKGIAIRPLAAFGYPNCLRISIGLPEENTALMQALKEILPTLS